MEDLMKYKDYFGSVHYNDNDRVFHGRVEYIRRIDQLRRQRCGVVEESL